MSNKLIAEFMELETKTFKSGILNYYYQDTFEGNWFEEGELSYNLSWDWLMPVVIKIGGTKDKLLPPHKSRRISTWQNMR